MQSIPIACLWKGAEHLPWWIECPSFTKGVVGSLSTTDTCLISFIDPLVQGICSQCGLSWKGLYHGGNLWMQCRVQASYLKFGDVLYRLLVSGRSFKLGFTFVQGSNRLLVSGRSFKLGFTFVQGSNRLLVSGRSFKLGFTFVQGSNRLLVSGRSFKLGFTFVQGSNRLLVSGRSFKLGFTFVQGSSYKFEWRKSFPDIREKFLPIYYLCISIVYI